MTSTGSSPVAVVTGGARRLGRQLCTALAGRGFDVVILYRGSEADTRSLEQEIGATGQHARSLQLDVGVEYQVAEVFDSIANTEGRVDLLVKQRW